MIRPVGPDLRAGPLGAGRISPVGWLVGAAFERKATCFLVAGWWIATAHHAAEDRREASDRIAVFNFHEGGDPAARDAYALAPETGHVVGPGEADFALVRLHERAGAPPPGETWGRIALAGARTPAPGAAVHSVQHYLSDERHVKSYSSGTVRRVDENWIEHDAASGKGSSGAPLFDDDGAWLGMHRGEELPWWRATRASLIVAALRAMSLPPDLREALEAPP